MFLGGRSSLEHLSLNASEAGDCTALFIRGGTNIVVRHCEITALRLIEGLEGKYVNAERVVTVEGSIENLVFRDSVFRGA